MKKLMILGGSRYALPVIKAAHDLGLYVITCDYLPDNIAHKYSDEYCNVSIIEKDLVLNVAKECNIDGIMSFACDPGVVTAAYVAEEMGLPFQCSYKSACILQDKGLFRDFLAKNNFNVPHAKRYTDAETPFNDLEYFNWPVIVKPVDSAGSKGVTKVDSPDDLKKAINIALDNAHGDAFIIEDFLTFKGYHSSADPFSVDGELKFVSYSDQLFDSKADNPYTPSMIIWPSTMEDRHMSYLTSETQRLLTLLGCKTGIYNIETCVDINDKPYLMEVSPRGGGCNISELQKLAYGVDLIENEVRSAVGLPLSTVVQTKLNGCWCEMVIHSDSKETGKFVRLDIDPVIKNKYVKVIDLSAKPGDIIHPFTGANMSLGDMFLKFEDRVELENVIGRVNEWLKIVLR